MITVELFCGTKSFSKVAAAHGHKTFTVDNDPRHEPDLCIDIMKLRGKDILDRVGAVDFLWVSPPCTCFSNASNGYHFRRKGKRYIPQTKEALEAIEIIKHTLELIKEISPRYFVFENPVSMLRNFSFMRTFSAKLRTVCYCQYGMRIRKPTDCWTNIKKWRPRPKCKPLASCHIHSPGTRRHKILVTGNLGLRALPKKDPIRSVVPAELCAEILRACEVVA